MATAVQNRKRLEYRLDHFVKAADTAITSQRRQIDQLRTDVNGFADVVAGLQRVEVLQRELYALDRQRERLAAGREYAELSWWGRAWRRITGDAPTRREIPNA